MNMHAIETTAVVEDSLHLRLAEPLREMPGGPVRVILLFDRSDPSPAPGSAWSPGFIDAAYGSCKDEPLEIPPELPYETNREPLA